MQTRGKLSLDRFGRASVEGLLEGPIAQASNNHPVRRQWIIVRVPEMPDVRNVRFLEGPAQRVKACEVLVIAQFRKPACVM